MDITDPPLDFAEIARGMGLGARCITQPDEIQPAFKEALSLNKPYMLEVKTEGKAEDTIDLTISDTCDWIIHLSENSVTLTPNESTLIYLDVTIEECINGEYNIVII